MLYLVLNLFGFVSSPHINSLSMFTVVISLPLEYTQTEHSYNKDLFLAFKLAPDLASIEHDAHHYVSTVAVNLYNTIILRNTTAYFLALTTLFSFIKNTMYGFGGLLLCHCLFLYTIFLSSY